MISNQGPGLIWRILTEEDPFFPICTIGSLMSICIVRYKIMKNPTRQTYTSLTVAYDFFNKELFSGSLPPCLITMQRHKGCFGYFSGERFRNIADQKEITDEIALNPAHFARKIDAILSTLVHEMVHLWQHHFGEPSRKSYHNKQWAKKMLEVGLIPTATGEKGGRITGQKMTHLIEENGLYARTVEKLLKEHPAILYCDQIDDVPARKEKSASKTKYTCPACGLNAWAKPAAQLVCGNCQVPMN